MKVSRVSRFVWDIQSMLHASKCLRLAVDSWQSHSLRKRYAKELNDTRKRSVNVRPIELEACDEKRDKFEFKEFVEAKGE